MPASPSTESLAPADASAANDQPAWSEQDLAGDPHAQEDKPARVNRMFAAIAPKYDLNNRLHSFGRDQAWRRKAVETAAPRSGDVVLDVACGTGDLTRLFAKSPASRVIGADFCGAMLSVASQKTAGKRFGGASIQYIEADAMALPIADNSVDIVSIAFGIRNVATPATAIGEFARVLRPGGRLVILEFSEPRNPVIRQLNHVYCSRIMPRTATLISRDTSGAYHYLPRSIDTFLDRDELAQLMRDAGFTAITQQSLTMGVCTCHRGIAT